jgi:hypothetical protein
LGSVKRLKSVSLAGVLSFVVTLGSASTTEAQFSIGAEGTYNNSINFGSWGLGGRVGVLLPVIKSVRPELVGGVVYYFPNCTGFSCSWWEAQGTVLLYNARPGPVSPYLGLGFSYHTFDLSQAGVDDTDWGIDFLLGSQLGRMGPTTPYAEVRYKFMREVPNQWGFTFGFRLES